MSERTPTLAAILAGGVSGRLGREKARVEVGGIPLAERVRRAVARVAPEIVVVGKAGGVNPLPDLPFVTDAHPVRCALAGIVRALRAAGERRLLVVACDHPFLAPGLLALLLGRSGRADARVPVVGGRLSPLPAVFEPGPAADVLARRLADGRLSVARALNELHLDLAPETDLAAADAGLTSFLNVNTEEDLARARRHAAENEKV